MRPCIPCAHALHLPVVGRGVPACCRRSPRSIAHRGKLVSLRSVRRPTQSPHQRCLCLKGHCLGHVTGGEVTVVWSQVGPPGRKSRGRVAESSESRSRLGRRPRLRAPHACTNSRPGFVNRWHVEQKYQTASALLIPQKTEHFRDKNQNMAACSGGSRSLI